MTSTRRRTINDRVAETRTRYVQLTASEAYAAAGRGARIVDLRRDSDRRRDGAIAGALEIDLLVLEWRVDPDSGATHPQIEGLDTELLLICNQGYASSLAVARLQCLGATRVSDVIGGFAAWRDAGLPVVAWEGPA